MKKRCPRLTLCLSLFAFCVVANSVSAQTEVQPATPGSLIRFENNGNITLNGHCFGWVASPPSGALSILNGQATAKDGNLYFRGSLLFNWTSSFPDQVVVRAGSVPLASIAANNLHLKGSCANTAGCANTRYEPARWNDGWGGPTQSRNNCYNYGNDTITNTFAQPGLASGQMWTSLTVSNVRDAALRDGLRWVGWNFPGNTYDCGDGHLIFMAVWPGEDYHWWRLDQSVGMWSHKIGDSPARNTDEAGATITNPLVANRGFYTDPGGFYCNCGGRANIR